MRWRLWLLLLIAGLTACAHYGNLAGTTADDAGLLATDTARAMAVVWPPAETRIRVEENDRDPFLSALIAQLRQSGYPVIPPSSTEGNELLYLVDRLDAGQIRVSVWLDGRSLHRLYRAKGGRPQPASAWSRQESGAR